MQSWANRAVRTLQVLLVVGVGLGRPCMAASTTEYVYDSVTRNLAEIRHPDGTRRPRPRPPHLPQLPHVEPTHCLLALGDRAPNEHRLTLVKLPALKLERIDQ